MTNSAKKFWQDKRIIVTGGAGFLGRFVCQKLEDHSVSEITIPRKAEYDLVNDEAVQQLLSDTTCNNQPVDMVLHLAAEVGGIGANRAAPASFFYNNLMMGVQLMHQGYLHDVTKVVAIGTVCAYPKFAPVPFRETDLWSGYPEETNAPYGLAKKMLLVQSQTYRQQYGYNSIFLLPTNLYGPGDNFDLETSHVIPALIRKCLEAKDSGADHIVCWGDGSATREFLYAKDAAEGIVLSAETYNDSEPVNLGSTYEISIKDLVVKIAELTQFEGEIRWDTSKPNGQPRRKLDVSRARELFGFEASTTFDAGLAETIAWYEADRVGMI